MTCFSTYLQQHLFDPVSEVEIHWDSQVDLYNEVNMTPGRILKRSNSLPVLHSLWSLNWEKVNKRKSGSWSQQPPREGGVRNLAGKWPRQEIRSERRTNIFSMLLNVFVFLTSTASTLSPFFFLCIPCQMNHFEMQIIETLCCQWFPKKNQKWISPEVFLNFLSLIYAKSNTNTNYSFMEHVNTSTTCVTKWQCTNRTLFLYQKWSMSEIVTINTLFTQWKERYFYISLYPTDFRWGD